MTELLDELRAALEATQGDPGIKHLAPHTRIQVNAALERLYAHRTMARPIPNEELAAEHTQYHNYQPTETDIDEFIAQIREYYK